MLGFGSGLTFPTIGNASLHEVTGQDSSLASGVQSRVPAGRWRARAVGARDVGLRHAASLLAARRARGVAITHGYVLAYRIGAGLLVVGGVLVLALLEHVGTMSRSPLAAPDDPAPTDLIESTASQIRAS